MSQRLEMTVNEVVIYHNPECGTSRNTLAMIRNAGIEPTVIEYLRDPLGTRLCRPSELVLDILPTPQKGYFAKEDGEVVIDQRGQRVSHH